MSSAVAVNPTDYTVASVSFGRGVAGGVNRVYNRLLSALADTEAMAGHDSAGRAWGHEYDTRAPEVFKCIWSLETANITLAMRLERTGFNHELADALSDSGHRSTVADTTDYAATAPYEICPNLPKAAGGSGDYPEGWSLVRGSIGFEWPDGQQSKLRSAAAAWDEAGNSMSALTSFVDDGLVSIALQDSPEVADALISCRAMASHLTDTAGMCHTMAKSCRSLATSIDRAHHKAVHALKMLVTLSAATQVTGAVFAVFSLGISEGVAQSAETAEIYMTATEVSVYLSAFSTEAGEAVLMVSSVDSEVLAVGRLLQPLMDADLVTADAALVAQLDTTGVLLPELQAEGRLAVAANRFPGLPEGQRLVAMSASDIYESPAFDVIRAAHAAGKPAEITVDGVTVLYEPDVAASGMTLFGERGFVIGREAFTSDTELAKTVAHETYRLAMSESRSGVHRALVGAETGSAYRFAETVGPQIARGK